MPDAVREGQSVTQSAAAATEEPLPDVSAGPRPVLHRLTKWALDARKLNRYATADMPHTPVHCCPGASTN